MTSIKAFIKRHPVLTYFALTFAFSWGGVLLVIGGPGALPATLEQFETLGPILYLVMLVGPSVAGILLTGLVYGRTGFRELLSRLLSWRMGARWYAMALLIAPLSMMAVLFPLSLTAPIVATEDKASALLTAIVAGLMVGIFEELGWTGFAIPRLRQRYGVLTAGLIVGLFWGCVALPFVLGKRQFLRSARPGPVARAPFFLAACLPGAHGLGLRPDAESARSDAHACESRSEQAASPAFVDRDARLDLYPRMGGRAVARCGSGRRGQPWAALAATAPEAHGLRAARHHKRS